MTDIDTPNTSTTTAASASTAQPGADRSVPAVAAAVAGLLAALAALVVGEIIGAASDRVPSLVVAVGDWVIDSADPSTTSTAIDIFGTNDKPALVIGIIVVSGLLGAVTGVAGRTRHRLAPVVFGLFAVVGALAAVRSPQASAVASWISALVAGAAGLATLRVILALSVGPQMAAVPGALTERARARAEADTAVETTFDRRRFIGVGGGVAAVSLAGYGVSRRLQSANSVAGERAALADVLSPVDATPAITTRVDSVEGISPYITPIDDFYRIDTALEVPQIDPDAWRLSISGLVDRPYELTLDDVLAMDLVDETVTISCVSNRIGGNLVGNATWTGVPLVSLLEEAGVRNEASQIMGRSWDGWTAGFPPAVLDDGRTALLAVAMNGEPLPIPHGFPARLVVAGLYGYVSAVKWVTGLELTTWEGADGYWIPRGWAKEGPIKVTSRIDVPRHSARVAPGEVGIGGVAWAPTRGIGRVEVSIDDGEWVEADLGEVVSDETWRQWTMGWDAVPGVHRIQVRAFDLDGEIQPPGPKDSRPDGAEGYHVVQVRVDEA